MLGEGSEGEERVEEEWRRREEEDGMKAVLRR